MNKTVFLCEDSTEGILSAIYEAWASRLGHRNVRIALSQEEEPQLFCDYRSVPTNAEHAEKVRASIIRKISGRAWQLVYRTTLANSPAKADDIYRFLVGGFYYGGSVTQMLTEQAVQTIWDHNRNVGNEAHFYREFLRFDSIRNNTLLARIRPKANVISLVAPHFADRLPDENFIILDVGRSIAAVHPAQHSIDPEQADSAAWYLHSLTEQEADALLHDTDDVYRELWCTFFRSVAIEQRINPSLQRNRMPIRYREFAPEFEHKNTDCR